MALGGRGSRTRCLVVECGASTALAATVLLTRSGVVQAVGAIREHRLDALPLDRALADLADALLLGCAAWLWLVSSYVVLAAVVGRGPSRRPPRWVPGALRRLVLSACGVAVAGALAAPAGATAAGGHHPHAAVRSPLSGLPLPERATVRADDHTAAHASGPADARTRARTAGTVVVATGDTLWSIAARDLPRGSTDAAVARRWRAVYAANRGRIGPDPDLIVPGLRLRLPGKDLP